MKVDLVKLGSVEVNPVRAAICEQLAQSEHPRSPGELSRELSIGVNNLAYHFTVLQKFGAIQLVRTRQVRGATEHFYELSPEFCGGPETALDQIQEVVADASQKNERIFRIADILRDTGRAGLA